MYPIPEILACIGLILILTTLDPTKPHSEQGRPHSEQGHSTSPF